MNQPVFRKYLSLAGGLLALWLGIKLIFPLILPFFLGALLAMAAEPAVKALNRKLPRAAAAGIGVGGTLIFLFGLLLILSALLIRQLGQLARILPDLEMMAQDGMQTAEDFLLGLAVRLPDSIRPVLVRMILSLFGSRSDIFQQIGTRIPTVISGFLSHLPGGALSVGTGIFSAFLISARMDKIKLFLKTKLLPRLKFLPAVHSVRTVVGGWLKAQVKLGGLMFLVVTGGLILLKIPYAPIWAAGIALLDAVPLLGTGIVLIPWGILQFLQGKSAAGFGFLALYGAATLTRSLMEPRLVGKQLGLDPLLTLFALYAGFRLWGIFGMLLAPVAVVAAMQFGEGRTS